jgi:GAF domain-containing protein
VAPGGDVAERIRAIAAAGAALAAAGTVEGLRDEIEKACRGVLSFDRLALWTLERGGGEVRDAGDGTVRPLDEMPWARAAHDRRSAVLPEIAGAARMVTPLAAGDATLGLLVLESASKTYGPADVEVAEFVAALAGAALSSLRTGEERRAAERAKHLADTRFRSVFEQFPLSMQLFDPEGWTIDTKSCVVRAFPAGAREAGGVQPASGPPAIRGS